MTRGLFGFDRLMGRIPVVVTVVVSLTSGLVVSEASGQGQPGAQDPSLDNLVHPDSQETVPIGNLGYAELVGHGPIPLVLIPGWGFGGELFDGFVRANRENYTMLVSVPAGYGGTPPAQMPADSKSYSERSWCRAFEAATWDLVEKLGLAPCLIGGFGDEFQCAVRLALDHPGKVSGLISFGGGAARELGAPLTSSQRAKAIDERMARSWFKTVTPKTWANGMGAAHWHSADPEVGERLYQASLATPIPTMVRYLCELWSHDPRRELMETEVPILAIHCVPDSTAKTQDVARFFNLVKSSWKDLGRREMVRQETVANARMAFLNEKTEEISEMVRSFSEGLMK